MLHDRLSKALSLIAITLPVFVADSCQDPPLKHDDYRNAFAGNYTFVVHHTTYYYLSTGQMSQPPNESDETFEGEIVVDEPAVPDHCIHGGLADIPLEDMIVLYRNPGHQKVTAFHADRSGKFTDWDCLAQHLDGRFIEPDSVVIVTGYNDSMKPGGNTYQASYRGIRKH